jgi:hypothetical protein
MECLLLLYFAIRQRLPPQRLLQPVVSMKAMDFETFARMEICSSHPFAWNSESLFAVHYLWHAVAAQ